MARGWFVASRPSISFFFLGGTEPADAPVTRGQAGGPSSAKAMGAGEDLLVLFPCTGGAFDQKHGFEAPSVHDGEAELTVADPSDLQHVSDEVLGDSMACLRAVRVALSDGQEARTSDFRTRVLGGHGTLVATGAPPVTPVLREHSGRQGLLRTARPPSLHAFQSDGSRRRRCRNLGARAAPNTNLSRMLSAPGTPCSDEIAR